LDDERLVAAHEEAAKIAFGELETFAATRVRKQGNQRDRTTGNLVAAAFTHTSSRALDPQLHTHFTVFNATFDDREQCWKALQAGGMYDAIRYGTAVYRNDLAKRVQQIGYQITPAKHGFEIKGVSGEVLKRFSKRSQEAKKIVQEMEQKLGRKLSNNAVALAVHQSRAGKIKGISTTEVRERQLAQLQPYGNSGGSSGEEPRASGLKFILKGISAFTPTLAKPMCNSQATPPVRPPGIESQRTNIDKIMQLKVSVISDRPDEYIGKRGLVKSQIITCQDVDPSGFRLLVPFDYTLNEDEKTKWAGKLQDKQIVIGVRELVPFGGRLRARGAIVTGPDGKN
jgi:hypothetical protein